MSILNFTPGTPHPLWENKGHNSGIKAFTSQTSFALSLSEMLTKQDEDETQDAYTPSGAPSVMPSELYNQYGHPESVLNKLHTAKDELPDDAVGSKMTIGMLLQSKGSEFTYRGVPFSLDTKNNCLQIGGHTKGNSQIQVNGLSFGGSIIFDRENMDIIVGMLDLFTPSDINKILEAVQLDNIVKRTEQENDENEAEAAGIKSERDEGNDASSKADEKSNIPAFSDKELADYDEESKTAVFYQKNENLPAMQDVTSKDKEESQTDTQIITKPDGTRILIMKVKIGGQTYERTIKLSEKDVERDSGLSHDDVKQAAMDALTSMQENQS